MDVHARCIQILHKLSIIVDYRALNKVTKKDVFPIALVDECLDTLTGNVWFSKLDANWAYLQVKVKDSDKEKTAFITKYGSFQFNRMGSGLCNAPSTFSRVMNLVLRGLHWNSVLAFLDDILVLGKDFHEHLSNIKEVLEKFRSYGLKLKPKKCVLFKQEVEFLGRSVTKNGLGIGSNYVDTIKKWPIPTCTKDVERFCGFANYHRNFIKDFAKMNVPLYAYTGKNRFHWGEEQQSAFNEVKLALASAPVLTSPTKEDYFILDTDASEFSVSNPKWGGENYSYMLALPCYLNNDAIVPQERNFLQLYFSPDISDTIYWKDILQFVPIIAAYNGY